MKEKEKAIRGLLLRDTTVLILFLAAFLGIGGVAFSQALPLAEGSTRLILTGAFLLALVVLTGAMLWVLRYLHQDQQEIYEEELQSQELIRKRKEAGR